MSVTEIIFDKKGTERFYLFRSERSINIRVLWNSFAFVEGTGYRDVNVAHATLM
jgi:hypothetical protein